MQFTTDGANLLLNWAFTTGTVVRPTTWSIRLHTADPTEAGTVGEVLVAADADYVAKNITFSASTVGQCLSTLAVAHTPAVAATAYTVTHISLWDTTNAVPLMYAPLVVPRLIDNANPLLLSIGDIFTALD